MRTPSMPARGQVLVIAALAMIVLIAMAGLAIDGGRGYWEQRQAQNAAEHAALAAAWEFCHPADPAAPDPVAKARAAAAANGFTHDGVAIWVTPSGSAGTYAVLIRSQLETTFAAIMGFETISAAGRAVADCRSTSGEGFAIFGGGHTCDDTGKVLVEISGSDNVVDGAVHSNWNLGIGGSDNDFNGPVTYRTSETHHNSTLFETGYPATGPLADWPVTFVLANYRTLALQSPTDDLYYFDEEINSEDIIGPGLYYSEEKIDLGDSDQDELITLVSEKEIIVGGSGSVYRPFRDNLLAFSALDPAESEPDLKKRCDVPGVKVSGGHNEWQGFIYAPKSQIDMSGSDTSTLIGSLIGWSIKVSGSSVNNTADPAFFAGPPVLRLVE